MTSEITITNTTPVNTQGQCDTDVNWPDSETAQQRTLRVTITFAAGEAINAKTID